MVMGHRSRYSGSVKGFLAILAVMVVLLVVAIALTPKAHAAGYGCCDGQIPPLHLAQAPKFDARVPSVTPEADVPPGPIYLVRADYDAITGEVVRRSIMAGPYSLDACLGKLKADWLPSPVVDSGWAAARLTRVECNVITLPSLPQGTG